MIRNNRYTRLLAVIVSLTATMVLTSLSSAQDKTPQDLADPDGKFTEIHDMQIYYIERGPQTGHTVLLLHGFGGSTFTWRETLNVLAEAGYHAIALDLPPFGLSDKRPGLDYSRNALVDVVAGLMDQLKIEKASLVGHSMGGSITAAFAITYPEHVSKLIFVAGAVGDFASDQVSNRQNTSPLSFLARFDPRSPLAAAGLRLFLTKERFTEILSNAYYDKSVLTPEVIAGYQRPLLLANWADGFLSFIASSSANDIQREDIQALGHLDVPVLLIWGAEDTWVPISVGEDLRNLMHNVTWIVYPNIGHLPMEENTKQFNIDLVKFLSR